MHATVHPALVAARVLAAHMGIRMSTLARQAGGRADTFTSLREGRVTIRRADHLLQWLSDQWPADLAWPAGIPRPAPSPGSAGALEPEPWKANLAAAMDLDPETGRVRSDAALRLAGGWTRGEWQHGLEFGDAGARAGEAPRKGSAAIEVVECLMAAGDARFARQVAERREDDEMMIAAGFTRRANDYEQAADLRQAS